LPLYKYYEAEYRVGLIHLHTFIPLPGTAFAKEKAGRINKPVKKMIKNLISQGIAYGNWDKQEKIGKKITKYVSSQYYVILNLFQNLDFRC